MIAKAGSVALVGMEGHPIDVEVSIAQGLPVFTIVGLPDPSIQEARERVRAAIQSSSEQWPQQRVTVNLSPAHLRKAGSSFDLAMALGILTATGRVPQERLAGLCVLGELSLDGAVRRVRGVLPAVLTAARARARAVVVPAGNAREAALVPGIDVLPVEHLAQAVRYLNGAGSLDAETVRPLGTMDDEVVEDLQDVRGQQSAKRAIEIAAAGGHNLLMIGPPGGGKTMLARRVPGVLPPMSEEEAFEVTRIYSVAGLLPEDRPLITRRPFRAPHHSASMTGLVGGGSGLPHPGEATLAHRGVLFMDEYGEFRREALDALRQPMEDGCITIVRSRWAVTYPARFQLIAASNPCPCGYVGDDVRQCVCLPGHVSGYKERLSGPIVDRIDLRAQVERVERSHLFGAPDGDASATIAGRVRAARDVQQVRWRGARFSCNAEVPPRDIDRACRLVAAARRAIEDAIGTGLTARGAHRTIRVARTIADLAGSDAVGEGHVLEALAYRLMEDHP